MSLSQFSLYVHKGGLNIAALDYCCNSLTKKESEEIHVEEEEEEEEDWVGGIENN